MLGLVAFETGYSGFCLLFVPRDFGSTLTLEDVRFEDMTIPRLDRWNWFGVLAAEIVNWAVLVLGS